MLVYPIGGCGGDSFRRIHSAIRPITSPNRRILQKIPITQNTSNPTKNITTCTIDIIARQRSSTKNNLWLLHLVYQLRNERTHLNSALLIALIKVIIQIVPTPGLRPPPSASTLWELMTSQRSSSTFTIVLNATNTSHAVVRYWLRAGEPLSIFEFLRRDQQVGQVDTLLAEHHGSCLSPYPAQTIPFVITYQAHYRRIRSEVSALLLDIKKGDTLPLSTVPIVVVYLFIWGNCPRAFPAYSVLFGGNSSRLVRSRRTGRRHRWPRAVRLPARRVDCPPPRDRLARERSIPR